LTAPVPTTKLIQNEEEIHQNTTTRQTGHSLEKKHAKHAHILKTKPTGSTVRTAHERAYNWAQLQHITQH